MAWPRKRIYWVAGSIVATLIATLVVLNLIPAEKRIEHRVERRYDTGSADYYRSLGVLLGPPVVAGNRIHALQNGDEIFPAMLAAIRGAQRTINFESYIYWSGDIGQAFADALVGAREGRRAACTCCSTGSARRRSTSELLDEMRDAGVRDLALPPAVAGTTSRASTTARTASS